MRPALPRWLTSSALLLAVLALTGLTWPRDDSGSPAPPCYFLDDSVTPNLLLACSRSNPLPTVPGGTTAASDPFGFGRTWFFGTYAPAQPPAALFLDQTTVLAFRGPGGANLAIDRSGDGGRTFPITGTFALPANRFFANSMVFNPTGALFLFNGTDNLAHPRVATSTNLTTWTFSADLTGDTSTFQSLGVQGNTVIVWGANTVAVALFCRSADNGATFGACTTIAGSNGPASPGGRYTVASPATGIWLLIDADGRIFRSSNDGGTFAQVAQITAGGGNISSSLICVSQTRCLAVRAGGMSVSTDAGATWAATSLFSNTIEALCNYGNGTVVGFSTDLAPSATGDYFGAAITINNGDTWSPVTVKGGFTAGVPHISAFTCSSGGKGFVAANTGAARGSWYNPTVSGGGLIFGSDGNILAIDTAGRLTANQGAAAALPNSWPVHQVQGPTLFNSQTASAPNAAVSITITGTATTRSVLRHVEARCSAGTSSLTVQDAAVTIWSTAAAEVGVVNFFRDWPTGLSATTGNNLVVTLAACGAANTGTIIVQGDRGP